MSRGASDGGSVVCLGIAEPWAMRYGFSRSENLEQHETEMLMQAKGQAVRSDALACYGVQIGQKLRRVDYAGTRD